MNIYICSLLSKKNFRFLNSHLKSLNRVKIPSNCKLKIIFVINPKIHIIKHSIKNFLNPHQRIGMNLKIFITLKKEN